MFRKFKMICNKIIHSCKTIYNSIYDEKFCIIHVQVTNNTRKYSLKFLISERKAVKIFIFVHVNIKIR